MPNPVTTEHIEARFRPLSPTEMVNADAWLDDAWALVTSRRPLLEAQLAEDPPLVAEANVIRVIAGMVIRKLQNPEGKSEETIDDYRYKRDPSVATGSLYVTDDELSLLTPLVAGSRYRGSVRLVAYGEL